MQATGSIKASSTPAGDSDPQVTTTPTPLVRVYARASLPSRHGELEVVSFTDEQVVQTELAIILTPRILRGDEPLEEWLPAGYEERLGSD